MSKFLILHYGFEKPDAEAMAKWMQWFESIADCQVGKGHLPGGREITEGGVEDLPFGKDSMTGYTMIEAADLDEAEAIAARCPIVAATRVYSIQTH